jgi:PAS domain S-box-containing protein
MHSGDPARHCGHQPLEPSRRFFVSADPHGAAVVNALRAEGNVLPMPSRLDASQASAHDCCVLAFDSPADARAKFATVPSNLPVVFYASNVTDAVRLELLRLGAQDVLDLGLDDDRAIRRAVLNAMARHEVRRPASGTPIASTEHALRQELNDLTANSRVSRLEWLLQGVLELQSLITDADFELENFMQRLVDVAERLTEAKGAVIELVDGDEMVYRCASASISEHLGLRLKRRGSLSGLCVAQAQVLRCDDAETDPRVDREACRRVGVRSMLCTPLFGRGHTIGVLKVMAARPMAFDSSDQYLLTLLSGALGAALGRQLVLEALKASEETFRTAMDTAPIGQALVRPDGGFIEVNKALCALLGYSESEMLAQSIESITHPNDLEEDLELLRRTLAGEMSSYRMEKRYLHKSGRTLWTLLSVSLVRDAVGRPSYFVAQVQDVTEQRELERVKSEFISVVSHELRTPMTSIRGALGLVLGTMGADLPPKAKSLLEIANNNCQRLIRLINDILDIDKIASGQMQFDMQERVLADVVRKALQPMESYAHRFQVELQFVPGGADWRVSVDEDRLAQVISNLVSNAVKVSPAHEVVRISAHRRRNAVRLCVADYGPGISEEFRSRIFEKFAQADGSEARRVEGTGLGLHISRQIVERMNGKIGFDTRLGKGTTFWVEFPLMGRAAVEGVAGVVSDGMPRILHVEDDPYFAEVLSAALAGRVETVVARTVADAQALLAEESFELILLDVHLPDRSGLDLLAELPPQSPPVVLLCADAPPAPVAEKVAAVVIKTRMAEMAVLQTIDKLLAHPAPHRTG